MSMSVLRTYARFRLHRISATQTRGLATKSGGDDGEDYMVPVGGKNYKVGDKLKVKGNLPQKTEEQNKQVGDVANRRVKKPQRTTPLYKPFDGALDHSMNTYPKNIPRFDENGVEMLPRVPKSGINRPQHMQFDAEIEGIKKMNPPGEEMPRHADFLILGGGAIGSSIAYWLTQWSQKQQLKIVVVERDPTYSRASSMLSAGGIRHQFSVPENVQLSMFGSEWLRNIKEHLCVIHEPPPDVGFNHQGYLFLAPPRDAQQLMDNVDMQRSHGAKVSLFSKRQLASKFPWMNLDGIECGSMGMEGEGWFDPWSFVRALKQKNLSMNVEYVHGEVVEFETERRQMEAGQPNQDRIESCVIKHIPTNQETSCGFAYVINAGGPWAGDIAEMAGIGSGYTANGDAHNDLVLPLPVEPRKRFVYVTHCPDGPLLDCPFVVDPSGVYVRREGLGGNYICGASPPTPADEPDIINFDVDYDFYNEFIWPKLAERIPAFNNSKLKSGWAGYYDYNYYDQNLVIGPHPYHTNFIFANGLSGHGLQHSIGVGRAVFEFFLYGGYKSIDLSRFCFERFAHRLPIEETGIV